MKLPIEFTSEEHLEDVMSSPSLMLINSLAQLEGDIIILGVAGKMGPTLARMAKRAAPHKRVIGVARFSNPKLINSLSLQGIECIQADLLSAQALTALPDAPNVVFMAGRKFGSQGSEWLTWAMNAHVPALIAQRYKNSRIVAFSTACVYPFVDVHGPGAPESLAPTPPGEYANSCVARERMFEHFSHEHQTSGCLLRLSYAIDMRYGVLHDVARTIWQGLPLSVAMGYANIIWQGDANDLALRALSACTTPTSAINLSGPPISIRDVAIRLAARMGKTVHLTDTEAHSAWLVDCHKANALWGPPSVALDTLLDWTAAWVMQGHKSLDKPTHFEVRDGHY